MPGKYGGKRELSGHFYFIVFRKNAVPLLYDNRCGFIMETNVQLELAYNFLQYTGVNVFLTGKAGTGKTTFLHRLKRLSPKRMIVLAPTGVAAINAGGVTIHSFFNFLSVLIEHPLRMNCRRRKSVLPTNSVKRKSILFVVWIYW